MISHPTRGKRRYTTRLRKNATPAASLFFIAVIAILAVWFNGPYSRDNPLNIDNSLLNIATTTRTGSDYGDLCSGDDIFGQTAALAFLIPGVILAFVGLAIVTDDYFVASLERICERLNLTEDVAGATFMAAGSSTPEFFASLLGVFVTKDEVGIGTIVGSAVFNILVIIGLSAALAGQILELDWRPLARDSFFYMLSIVLLLIFVLPSTNGQIEWWEGLILVMGYVVYVLFMAYGNKPYMKWAERFVKKKSVSDPSDVDVEAAMATPPPMQHNLDSLASWSPSSSPTISQEKRNYHELNPRTMFRAAQIAVIAANRLASSSSGSSGRNTEGSPQPVEPERGTFLGITTPKSVLGWIFFPATFFWSILFKYTIVDCSSEKKAHLWWLTFLVSILWISGISYIMVEAARISGCLIGIPAPALGLTVLAAGTSVPDALASISVARAGAGDMAVSNAIGSNVFDILLGLGFPWFLGHLINGKQTQITTEPVTTVIVPILILFAVLILLVILLVLVRWRLRPLVGYILFAMYGLFVAYALIDVYVISK